MNLIINCDCGHVVHGSSEDELAANAAQHAREAHGVEMTREQALSLAVPLEA